MFKYLFLKTIYDISDVDVVERSRFDMSLKYFLGMTPEEDVINPSSLTKFRKFRLKDTDLLNLLIGKAVCIAIEKGIIRSKPIIVDATHSLSRSNPLSPIEVLKERDRQLPKVVYSTDGNRQGRIPKKDEDEDNDNDLGHQLSYCGKLEKEVGSDEALRSLPKVKEKLNLLKETKAVAKLNPSITQGFRQQGNTFDYNKDAGMFVCPCGHMAVRKVRQGKKGANTNQAGTYYFDVEKCKTCALNNGCYKPGAKTKTYPVPIKPDGHQQQMGLQQAGYFKGKAKHRYKVEAKNSELKNVHGYARACPYGIAGMQMQGAMAIFTVNLKRILKLMD